MKKKFILSEKRTHWLKESKWNIDDPENPEPIEWINVIGYEEKDVKEFIRRLKNCYGASIIGNKPYYYNAEVIYKDINELAGEKLI